MLIGLLVFILLTSEARADSCSYVKVKPLSLILLRTHEKVPSLKFFHCPVLKMLNSNEFENL